MPNGVLKEITPDDRSYYMASDITALLGISKSKAYDMIRTMRKECIDAGKLTKAYPIGRIPKKYFDEYCIDAVADCYDAEGSEVHSERNTVWSHLCFGRRASYFCLRDGFKQWTI